MGVLSFFLVVEEADTLVLLMSRLLNGFPVLEDIPNWKCPGSLSLGVCGTVFVSSSSESETFGFGFRKEYVLFLFQVSIRIFHRARRFVNCFLVRGCSLQ